MAGVNTKRVWLGGIIGAVVWFIWSGIVNFAVLAPRYATGQEAGLFLKEPRYPFFVGQWFVVLILLSIIGAWIYAGVRTAYGPGPKTALKVGLFLGFAAGFPISFSLATWSPMDRVFPLWWLLELWVGAVLSTFVSGWLYREA
jgi:hypothetical protein